LGAAVADFQQWYDHERGHQALGNLRPVDGYEGRAQNVQHAIDYYRSALRVCTEEAFPTYWAGTSVNLAPAHRAAGDYAPGVEMLLPVVAAQPGNANAAYNLACLLALQGRAEEALEHLARAIGLDEQRYRALAAEDEGFSSLREDPRFQALVAETTSPPASDDGQA
jgi:tetratricopeptide (TPR) repeat protein